MCRRFDHIVVRNSGHFRQQFGSDETRKGAYCALNSGSGEWKITQALARQKLRRSFGGKKKTKRKDLVSQKKIFG
jgi:hypothetical protein